MKIRTALFCAASAAFIASSGFAYAAYTGQFNIVQWAGVLLGAPTAAGTSASGNILGVQGVTGGVSFPSKTGPYVSAGTGQYGVSIASSTALTVPGSTLAAEICVETAAARYTDDGATTPTSSVGIPVPAGSCWQLAGGTLLSAFRIIGTGATIDVSYYK